MRNFPYLNLYDEMKYRILSGEIRESDLLPSENELAAKKQVTRLTVRRALEELVKDGFIQKVQGLGSKVISNHRNLGLPFQNIYIAGDSSFDPVKLIYIKKPHLDNWDEYFFFPLSPAELAVQCISYKLLRVIGEEPVMLEQTSLPDFNLSAMVSKPFENLSLAQTLFSRYQVEILSARHEIRAILADKALSRWLQVKKGKPLVQVNVKFSTTRNDLFIYSRYIYSTEKYALVNR